MHKYQKSIAVLILMLIFSTWFLYNTKRDLPLIFKKDLLAHDESSNSVVAANITRKFFPPMIRINPLNDQQGNWMEGPFWQHIPPLFGYVPYVFFKLDGQITIEVKRLAYAFVTLLTGLLFIFSAYKFRKSLLSAIGAAIAAIFWINTPFTRGLITGNAFGVSDIVLAFTFVCSFGVILWYLKGEREERLTYSFQKLAIIALIVALPIMAKNLLGAIPAATFFGLLFFDHKKINKKFVISFATFFGLLLIYYLPLYFASPVTFQKEIIVPFFHTAAGYEGWGRSWHWYLTNYLPQRYLLRWTWVYYLGLILALISNFEFRISKQRDHKDKTLLVVSGGWFVWNLLAVSLIQSKIPNFIYQTYLLSLFFIVYSLIIMITTPDLIRGPLQLLKPKRLEYAVVIILAISILVTGYEAGRFIKQFKTQRAQAYSYQSEHEKFYQTAEELRAMGLGTKDLIIVRVSYNDCWFRYYPLFLTGTESKTLLEMSFGFDANAIKQKYQRMYFVENDYLITKFDLTALSADQTQKAVDVFLSRHKRDIQADILRIKKDKTSCQWLVPDSILNSP